MTNTLVFSQIKAQPRPLGYWTPAAGLEPPWGVCQSLLMLSSSSPFTHFLLPAKGIFTEASDL